MNILKTILLIAFVALLAIGFLKFLFNALWGKKSWYPKFNTWYWRVQVGLTFIIVQDFAILLLNELF